MPVICDSWIASRYYVVHVNFDLVRQYFNNNKLCSQDLQRAYFMNDFLQNDTTFTYCKSENSRVEEIYTTCMVSFKPLKNTHARMVKISTRER